MENINLINDLSNIVERRNRIKDQIEVLKKELSVIDNTLIDMFENDAKTKLADKGQDFGDATIDSGDFKVKVSLKKKVTWNQEGLMEILDEMSVEEAKHFAKVSITVPEAKFNNATPEIKAKLSQHRTVEPGSVSVDIRSK